MLRKVRKYTVTCGPPSRLCQLIHVSTCVALIAGLTPGKVSFALQSPGAMDSKPLARTLVNENQVGCSVRPGFP